MESIFGQSQQENDPMVIDMGLTLQVPGLLHILHNSTRELGKQLAHWDTWVQQLKVVSKLLRHPWKARFPEHMRG